MAPSASNNLIKTGLDSRISSELLLKDNPRIPTLTLKFPNAFLPSESMLLVENRI